MLDLQEVLTLTECNAVVVLIYDGDVAEVQPLWECESEEDARHQALRMAIRVADKQGIGSVKVRWAYRPMSE